MLKKIRETLAAVGGTQAVLALAAIGWGLSKLQSIADERTAHLEALAEAAAEQEAALRDLAMQRHPAGKGRTHTMGDGTFVDDPENDTVVYPAPADLDPLGQAVDDRG